MRVPVIGRDARVPSIVLVLAVGCAVQACNAPRGNASLKPPLPKDAGKPSQSAADCAAPPPARQERTLDQRAGIEIDDPYRWMERPSDELSAWARAEADYAACELKKLPERDAMLTRMRAVTLGSSVVRDLQMRGTRAFYLEVPAGQALARLVVREVDGSVRVLAQPPSQQGHGSSPHHSIDGFSASPDGSLVAYNLSPGDSEIAEVRLVDVAKGDELADRIQRVRGWLAVTWLPDGRRFLYTQLAAAQPGTADPLLGMRVLLHRVGRPASDDEVVIASGVSADFPLEPREVPRIRLPPGSEWLIATAGGGARKDLRIAVAKLTELRGAATRWRAVAAYDDRVSDVTVGGSELYLLSQKDAPFGRVLGTSLTKSKLQPPRELVAERSDMILLALAAAPDALYVRGMWNGSSKLLRVPHGSTMAEALTLPTQPAGVYALLTHPREPGVALELQSWTSPVGYWRYVPASNRFEDVRIGGSSTGDYARTSVVQAEVRSHDGESVPLTLLGRSLDTEPRTARPTILYAYGAYGAVRQPMFFPAQLPWFERNGLAAICHCRGGGEKGDRWYQTGKGKNKRNGILDVIACAEYLIEAGYATPKTLFLRGESMGALVVGRAFTERPELFAAVAISAGMLNPVRFMQGISGAKNMAELADPETDDGLRALYEMDTYHHVRSGTRYPPVLLTHGLNDTRVSAWMSAKLAAKLRAAGQRMVLLRLESDVGHGVGATREQQLALDADIQSFFLTALPPAGGG